MNLTGADLLNAVKNPTNHILEMPRVWPLAIKEYRVEPAMLNAVERTILEKLFDEELVRIKKSLEAKGNGRIFNPSKVFHLENRKLYFFE
jgi:hypothetical protein